MSSLLSIQYSDTESFNGRNFPSLDIPSIVTEDADGYLKTIAQAAIEQVKFLSVYSGMPLAALYSQAGTLTEQADGNDSDMPDLLWTAQNNLLERQITYLKDIKDTYAEKRQDLPQGFSMRNFINSDFFKWAVSFALTLIPGEIDDAIYKAMQEHAHKVVGWALVWLQKAYYAGSLLCAAMADENAYLKRLEKSRENYELRSRVIAQHDQSIQSLLQQVALAESQAAQMAAKQSVNEEIKTLEEEKRLFMKEAFSERVFECPYAGLCLGEKNSVANISEFDIESA